MGCCCSPPESVKPSVNSKKETNGRVKWAKGQNGLRAKVAKCENGPRVKMGQGSKWAKVQNGPRVKMGQEFKMGYCCLSPERVELTLNIKKETNGRVKMGQGPK